MNVRQLIQELQKCNPEYIVVFDGYEFGLDQVDQVETNKFIILDEHKDIGWSGRHGDTSNKNETPCVYLKRDE